MPQPDALEGDLRMKIFMFGFDGLRPDIISEQTMPNLTQFLQGNANFTNHRSVFPSETYVNHPSIYTGFLPYRHGLVANAFFEPVWSRDEYFVGNSVEKIEAVEHATKGSLFEVPSLLETLSSQGKSMISVSSNSSGSTRLMAHKAEELGGVNISTCGLRYALPEDLRTRFGSDPADGKYPRPDIPGLKKMNEIVNHLFSSQGVPDLSIIWYGEPDNTFHAFGIGSEQSKTVLKAADECFAEIIHTWATEDTYVFVLSDHGHITVKEHFDIDKALSEQGFEFAGRKLPEGKEDFGSLWGYSGNLYVREPKLIIPLVQALQKMPQIGMLFTRDKNGIQGIAEGTFSQALIGGEHHRAGDIRYTLRTTDEVNANGYAGMCYCPEGIEIGSSIHGGLHKKEMHALLGIGGPACKKATVFDNPTSVIDVIPTVYALLDITPLIPLQGRILKEVVSGDHSEEPDQYPPLRKLGVKYGDYKQILQLHHPSGIPYVVSGERVR